MIAREQTTDMVAATDLEGRACAALQSSPHRDIRHVRCELRGGVLTLHGQVKSYYLKQLAQEQLQKLPDRCALDNRIVVVTS